MGRIRTIKPELIQETRVANLSDAAFRVFVGLVSLADDAGTAQATPSYLRGQIMYAQKRSIIAIGQCVSELERARLVDIFTVDCVQYAKIIGWSEKGAPTYQRIDKSIGAKYPRLESSRSWNEFQERSTPDPIRSETKERGGDSALSTSSDLKADHRYQTGTGGIAAWKPTVELEQLARSLGLNVNAELRQFRLNARAKGHQFADLGAAFEKFLRGSREARVVKPGQYGPRRPHTVTFPNGRTYLADDEGDPLRNADGQPIPYVPAGTT